MKRCFVMIMCFIFTILVGCGKTDTVKNCDIDAKIVSYSSLAELESASDAIIRVTKNDNEIPVISRSGEYFTSGFTFSDVTIKEIYADKSESLKIGDVLRVLENEVYDEQTKTIYHVAGYEKMVPECEYILLVKKNTYTDGELYYTPLGAHYGVVSLEDDGRYSDTENKHSAGFNISLFDSIWDEILHKYAD